MFIFLHIYADDDDVSEKKAYFVQHGNFPTFIYVHCALRSVTALRTSISLSHAMRPGLQIRHFWVAKSLFLTITFHQKKQDKTFCF